MNPLPNKEQKLKKRIFIIKLILLSFTLLISFGFTYSHYYYKNSLNIPNPLNYNLQKPVIIMVAGTDQEYKTSKYGYAVKVKNTFHGRTDTIILFKFDPINKRIVALNIPRDTRVFINGKSPDKINSINVLGRPTALRNSLERLFDLKIDHFILVDTKGVEKIIDEAGGIAVDIPKRMVYRDKTDGLNINLEAGRQTLTGKQAVGFLRFRHDNLGDIGRIQRQQIFLRAIKQKLADPSLYAKIPQLTKASLDSVLTDSNLTFIDLIKLSNFTKSLPENSHIFATLPGDFSMPETQTKVIYEEVTISKPATPTVDNTNNPYSSKSDDKATNQTENETPPETVKSVQLRPKVITYTAPFVSYWLPNEAEIEKLINKLFKNETIEAELENISAKNIKVAIESICQKQKGRQALRILTNRLSKAGFEIIDISTANKFEKAGIYAQKGNLEEADFLRDKLNLEKSDIDILAGSAGSPLADITIVLDSDLADKLISLEKEI